MMVRIRKSRLSKSKQYKLTEHFVAGTTARCAASIVGVNFKTAAFYFRRLRELIAFHNDQAAHEAFSGEIEVDESYFGGTRKGKRGRADGGKVPVFGLLVYSDYWPAYNVLDVSGFKHFRINHSKLLLVEKII